MHDTFLGVYHICMCRLHAEVHGGGLGAEPPEASEINFLNLDYSLHQNSKHMPYTTHFLTVML